MRVLEPLGPIYYINDVEVRTNTDAELLVEPGIGLQLDIWDLLQLSRNGATDGGEQLRRRIQALL